jgi:hypothetical protein
MFSHSRASQSGEHYCAPGLKRHAILLSICLLLIASAQPAAASSRSVNLAEMTSSAGRIVHGRVAEVRAGRHPQYQQFEVTFVTLDVIEMLKGAAAGRVTFMQYAGGDGMVRNSHMPQYKVGEEVVLFLYPESRYGLTSPIGEGQGKFLVRKDARTGQQVLQNERGNRALFERLDTDALQVRMALNRTERGLLAQPQGAAEFTPFRSLVRKMATANAAAKPLPTSEK